MSDVIERLRAANPVPRDLSTGWSHRAEGRAVRSRPRAVELEPQPGRRRQWLSAAVAAAVVLGLVAAVLVTRGSDDSVKLTTASVVDRLARGTWKEIDAGPARGLENVTTMWTGREVIVWGDRGSETSDGAAYDPSTRKWRELAPSPLGLRTNAVVRWLGDEMMVWGGWDPAEFRLAPATDGALYAPETDTWRRLAPAPFGPPRADLGAISAVWTGAELVATNPLAPQGPAAAVYYPRQNVWGSVPDPPVSLAGNDAIRATWTGRSVVYVVPSGSLAARAAVAFDPRNRTWRDLEAPFPTGIYAAVGLVRDGHTAASLQWNTDDLEWVRLDSRGRWQSGGPTLTHPFICDVEASPVSRGAVVACDRGHLIGLDLRDGTWHRFPVAPDPLPDSVTWTGRELFAFSESQLLALEPARL